MYVIVQIFCLANNTYVNFLCKCKTNTELQFTRKGLLHACPFLKVEEVLVCKVVRPQTALSALAA